MFLNFNQIYSEPIFCCEEFKNEILFSFRSLKFWQHKFGKGLLRTGYYFYLPLSDFVKENRKVTFTYNVFVFIYT